MWPGLCWILEWRWETASLSSGLSVLRASLASLSLPAEADSRASLQPHVGQAASTRSPEKADENGQLQGSWRRQSRPLTHIPREKPGRAPTEAVAMLRRATPAGQGGAFEALSMVGARSGAGKRGRWEERADPTLPPQTCRWHHPTAESEEELKSLLMRRVKKLA